jgi:hypothetical protein
VFPSITCASLHHILLSRLEDAPAASSEFMRKRNLKGEARRRHVLSVAYFWTAGAVDLNFSVEQNIVSEFVVLEILWK